MILVLRNLFDNSSKRQSGLMICMLLAFSPVLASEPQPVQTPESVQNSEQGFAETFNAAFAHDPQLKSAYWTYLAEQEEAEIGFSGLLPDISLSAGYQYEDSNNIYTDENNPNTFKPTEDRSGGELEDTYWRLNLRQPLYNYPAYNYYQKSKAVAQASEFNYQRAEQELIYRVAERYLSVLLGAQQVFLNQQKLDALELKREQTERAKELGVGDQLQVLHVKSSRDLARSDLLEAKSQLSDAQTLLSNLTGADVNLPESWVGSSDSITPSLLTGTQAEWLNSVNDNLSVKEARARISQENSSLAESKGEHHPTLNLNLSYLDRKSDDEYRTRKDAIAAIELVVPLYSGGKTQAKVRKARARVLASKAELGYTIMEKEQQIKLSYNRLLSFTERLIALAESRESGKRYLEAAERQLSLNLSDQVNVLDARTRLVDTQLQIAQTLNDYLLSDLILRLEAGRLNQERLSDYDQLFNSANGIR